MNLKTLRIAQHELLVRLVDEKGRIVPPGEFLGIAERAGLIRSIDRWVLRQAIRLLAEQARRGHALSRSFIRSVGQDPVDSHIVKAIVEVAAGLGIQTIAECVEEASTIEHLRQYGVDFAQGYGIGRPLPIREVDFAAATSLEPT